MYTGLFLSSVSGLVSKKNLFSEQFQVAIIRKDCSLKREGGHLSSCWEASACQGPGDQPWFPWTGLISAWTHLLGWGARHLWFFIPIPCYFGGKPSRAKTALPMCMRGKQVPAARGLWMMVTYFWLVVPRYWVESKAHCYLKSWLPSSRDGLRLRGSPELCCPKAGKGEGRGKGTVWQVKGWSWCSLRNPCSSSSISDGLRCSGLDPPMQQ